MMNIQNFEQYTDNVILDRGYEYFLDDKIVIIGSSKNNTYTFMAYGTDVYHVELQINDGGEILYHNCDCPYDFSPLCKHIVAAIYLISDIYEEKIYIDNNKIKSQNNLNEILNNKSKEELIDIIMEISDEHPNIGDKLQFRYSKNNKIFESQQMLNIIDNTINKYTYRGDLINYQEAYELSQDLIELVFEIQKKEDHILGIELLGGLLEAGIDALEYADDSAGGLREFTINVIKALREIVCRDDILGNLEEEIFNKTMEILDKEFIQGWGDIQIDILRILSIFSEKEDLRTKFMAKIHKLRSKCTRDYIGRYMIKELELIEFEMIKQYCDEEEKEKFLMENIKNSSFREKAVNKLVQKKDYDEALKIILDGEEKDKDLAGLVKKWKKMRYDVYKRQFNENGLKTLGKELLLQGNIEYYYELKNLHSQDELFYENIKKELKNNHRWNIQEVYLKIITYEKDTLALLEYVQKKPHEIEEYADDLKDIYKDQVISIYEQYIKYKSLNSSNRKEYKRVCRVVKNFNKIAGDILTKKIIKYLKLENHRKPAFLDELSKL